MMRCRRRSFRSQTPLRRTGDRTPRPANGHRKRVFEAPVRGHEVRTKTLRKYEIHEVINQTIVAAMASRSASEQMVSSACV